MKKVLITALVVLSLVLAVSCSTNYTVSFEANGGKPAPTAQTVAAGGVVVQPVSPEKDGYKFKAWYKDEACTIEYDFTSKVNSSFKLYAGYDKIIVPVVDAYKVSFETFGGTPVPETQLVKKGGVATCPTVNPVLDGYTFKGWYTDTTFTTAFDWSTVITADTVIYAKWEGGKLVTVSFAMGGGAPQVAPQVIPYGSAPALPVYGKDFSKEGYDFLYWASENGEAFVSGTKVYGDTVLKAIWSEGTGGYFVTEGGVVYGLTVAGEAYVNSTGNLIIPDGITGIADGNTSTIFFDVRNDVKYIELPASLEYVGDFAFADMPYLESIMVRKAPTATKSLNLDPEVNKRLFNINAKELGKQIIGDSSVTELYLSEAVELGEKSLASKDEIPGALLIVEAPKVVLINSNAFGYNGSNNVLNQLIVPAITKRSEIANNNALEGLTNLLLVINGKATGDFSKCASGTVSVLKESNEGELVFDVVNSNELSDAVTIDCAKVNLAADITLSSDVTVSGVGVELDFCGKDLREGNYKVKVEAAAAGAVKVPSLTAYVGRQEDLATAVRFNGATVKLKNNIELASYTEKEKSIKINITSSSAAAPATKFFILTIDLNEKTIYSNDVAFELKDSKSSDGAATDGKVVIKNGSIEKKKLNGKLFGHNMVTTEGLDLDCVGVKFVDKVGNDLTTDNGDGYYLFQASSYDAGSNKHAIVSLKDCDFVLKDTDFTLKFNNTCAVIANYSAQIAMENCTVDSTKGAVAAWVRGGRVTINGGTYKAGVKTTGASTTYYDVIRAWNTEETKAMGGSESEVYVTAGNFTGTINLDDSGNVVRELIKLSGGTYNAQPKAEYIADGYEAKKTGSNWVVQVASEEVSVYKAAIGGTPAVYYKTSLAALRDSVNVGENDNYSGYVITLLKDVDLSGEQWVPIGSPENPFAGSFDGGNHIIKGLTFTATSLPESFSGFVSGITTDAKNSGIPYGFFGVVGDLPETAGLKATGGGIEKVEFKNVEFTDVNVTSPLANMVGTLIGGDTAAVKIGNSYVNENLTVDIAVKNVKVSSGTLKCDNTSGTTLGGIVGKLYTAGCSADAITFTECVNKIKLSATATQASPKVDVKVGGIIGYVCVGGASSADYGVAEFVRCKSSGDITCVATQKAYAGGLTNCDTAYVRRFEVVSCVSEGAIKGTCGDGFFTACATMIGSSDLINVEYSEPMRGSAELIIKASDNSTEDCEIYLNGSTTAVVDPADFGGKENK